jgi:hypothetical protein
MVLPLVGEYVAAFFEPLHSREGVFYFSSILLFLKLKKILKFKIQLTAIDIEIASNVTFSISLTASNKKYCKWIWILFQ